MVKRPHYPSKKWHNKRIQVALLHFINGPAYSVAIIVSYSENDTKGLAKDALLC